MLGGEPVPLDAVDSEGGGVDQDVDEVVGQQVDLVDVEHAAVGGGQEAGPEPGPPFEQGALEIEGADDAVLGGADRQFHERGAVAEQRGQRPGRGRLA